MTLATWYWDWDINTSCVLSIFPQPMFYSKTKVTKNVGVKQTIKQITEPHKTTYQSWWKSQPASLYSCLQGAPLQSCLHDSSSQPSWTFGRPIVLSPESGGRTAPLRPHRGCSEPWCSTTMEHTDRWDGWITDTNTVPKTRMFQSKGHSQEPKNPGAWNNPQLT